MTVKSNGLTRIDRIAPARMRSRASAGSTPSDVPSAARMKENSPIWARLAAMVKAVLRGRPAAATIASAASEDRNRVGGGKGGSVRVGTGGCRDIKKKKQK